MAIDYSALEQKVTEWQEGYIQHIRETQGEDFATVTERELKGEPWKALKWFVEDNMPLSQMTA